MSGFAAVLTDGAPAGRTLERLIAAAPHRGTAEVFGEGAVALAAFDGRRGSGLHVAPDLVVAVDARIDEVSDLVDEGGDAAVVAAAWRRWGADGLARLTGDFAGAVYERRARRLWVIRDAMAGRHAFVAATGGAHIAATSLPMLLAEPLIDREIDAEWIAAYLLGAPGFATATGYRGIRRVRPGFANASRTDGWSERRWHSWRARRIRARSDEEYAEGLREVLDEAVRCRAAGASRLGISLSGGLDSTSIAACARAVAPELEIVALAVPFTGARADERPLQESVAARIGAELRWAPLDGSPWGQGPEDLLRALGAPPVAPNHFMVQRIVRAGAEAGVTVAMDGIDGDGVLAGNWLFLSDLFVRGRWMALRREMRALEAVHGLPARAAIRHYVVSPLVPRRLKGRSAPPHVDLAAARRAHRRGGVPWRPGRSFAASEARSDSADVAPAVLEAIDEEWVRAGIEPAHPLRDRRVLEYCLGLPREQKVRAGITKVALREAMRLRLPAEVTARPAKAEFGSFFLSALLDTGSLHVEKGLALVTSNPLPSTSPAGVARMSERFREGVGGFDAYRVAFAAHWRDWISRGTGAREGARDAWGS